MRSFILAIILALTSTAFADPPAVELVRAFPKLHFNRPLFLTHPGDGTDRVFVVEQDGRVWWWENDAEVSEPRLAIDIRGKVRRDHNEEGLLGLAFHPKFAENRQVFLHYSASNPRRNVLSRFTMNAERTVIDPRSEVVILEVEQPWGNHNGGMMAFAPAPGAGNTDGFLYVSLGDGGSAGDPRNAAQQLNNLLGKIIRIDVDHQDPGLKYAIPKDNPFVGNPGARGEIWAYGLRNVWRFSFDRATGELWGGDVGQNEWEEIDLITKGGNYGWKVREARHHHDHPKPGAPTEFIEPVAEHNHREALSITGGYVYRGKAIPGLAGWYVYGDFVTGFIWAVGRDGDRFTEPVSIARNGGIASFGEDRDGELYITSFDGKIYRFQAVTPTD